MRFSFPALTGIVFAIVAGLLGVEDVALAQNIQGAIDVVSGTLSSNTGNAEFGAIASGTASLFIVFVNAAAVLAIAVAGFLAIIAQDENRIQSARTVVVSSIVAIVLVNTAVALSSGILQSFDFDSGASGSEGVGLIETEVVGFLSFVEVPIAAIAILVIIISGIKAVIDYGGEQGMQQFKKTIISVIFGIIIITTKFLVTGAVVTDRNPDSIVTAAVNVTKTLISYAALAGVVVIVIAGIFMIVNVGNDQQYSRAKGIIVRVALGLTVMIVAVALAFIIIDGTL